MPIQLTPEAEALIQQKVRLGLYTNAEAAIEAAVQLLDEHDRRLQRLRLAIAAGEVGEAFPWTPDLMEEIEREAEEMHRRGEAPDPDVCPFSISGESGILGGRRRLPEVGAMDAYFELFDVDSGNVIEAYERERDAIDALVEVATAHGLQAIESFALTHISHGKPVLIALQGELVTRVEHEMRQIVPQRRTS